ncbi:MAG TPA: GNAT family N-acetyltransferase [Methanosarcinaceae archaeon]|nr:GNAT family N-acetyltransferase [Methanosarcinaceae archaeon]
MIIKIFSTSLTGEVKDFVLGVLKEQGFEFDLNKDFDLGNIDKYYLQSGGVFYVGVVDGAIIGTSAVRRIDDEQCEIKRIYVRKDFRGRGFGRELFLKSLEFASHNFSVALLKTDAKLTDAIGLYLKNGFSVVKEEDGVVYFSQNMT